MFRISHVISVSLVTGVLFGLPGCNGDVDGPDGPLAPDHTVRIFIEGGLSVDQETVEVERGETVAWVSEAEDWLVIFTEDSPFDSSQFTPSSPGGEVLQTAERRRYKYEVRVGDVEGCEIQRLTPRGQIRLESRGAHCGRSGSISRRYSHE